jgi:pimeloyl-ACP methyl ester carboxylesterase
MSAWLDDVLGRLVPKPALVVAAGHAAGYLLRHAATRPTDFGRAVLVAPTWRGPLPTMLARRPDWLARLRTAVDTPALGPAIYRLNISRPVIRMMAKGHVYGDPDWLAPERFSKKMDVVAAPGARFASVRFVTGALDPFEAPEPFRAAAAHLRDRLLLIWGTATPPRSRGEMEAMAEATGLTPILVPGAKLGVHEEYPDAVADAITGWLDRPSHP